MREFLKQARKQKKLTQAQIAESIGISARQYRRIENEESVGSLGVLKDISKLLDVDMNLF